MRMVAGFAAAQCVTFAWLVFLSMPVEPAPSPPRDTGRRSDVDEVAMVEVRELRERVRSLESLLATLQSDRTPAPVVPPPASTPSTPPLRETFTVDERDLEVRAQQPVDWMALERFAGRWVDKDDAASTATLALMGPMELLSQFGPPSNVAHTGDSMLWTYESAAQDATGRPLTRIQILVGHGSVLGVNRRSRP